MRAPAGVRVHRHTVEGHAHRLLFDASADAGPLVPGARYRVGHPCLRLGRVAHAVLPRSGCPVAVVPRRV
ncbi:adenine nucleotide alpha hydrolase family protein [Streptomyces achromogenes]|uniref:hypothetical protein n=1 Tax=Streptomyces achromogenes TaxID=67255 RepID=UPI0031585805